MVQQKQGAENTMLTSSPDPSQDAEAGIGTPPLIDQQQLAFLIQVGFCFCENCLQASDIPRELWQL